LKDYHEIINLFVLKRKGVESVLLKIIVNIMEYKRIEMYV
jgi:hypothetical protein